MDINAIPRYSADKSENGERFVIKQTIGKWPAKPTIFEDCGPYNNRIDSPAHIAARLRAKQLNQDSFSTYVARYKFTRYLTWHYVSVDMSECVRHAKLDSTPAEKIRITPNVGILHYADTWMLWDDGKITTGIGITLPQGGILTPAAKSMISAVRGADAGVVNLPGGLLALTKIDNISEEDIEHQGPSRGYYASERIERLHVRWLDGTESDLFVVTAGYFEGYRYDIFPTLEAAEAEFGLSPNASGISTFPLDEYEYDPRLGYVSKE